MFQHQKHGQVLSRRVPWTLILGRDGRRHDTQSSRRASVNKRIEDLRCSLPSKMAFPRGGDLTEVEGGRGPAPRRQGALL